MATSPPRKEDDMTRTVYATMMAVCACVALVVASGGCSVAPSREALATETDEIRSSEPIERAVTELPLRSEDLVDMAAMDATLNAACPTPRTCTGFNSCASWSTTTSCGTRVCGTECFRCLNPKDPICFSGINRSTFTSRFRVCFNAQQQACTEFQVFTATTCQTSPTGDCCSQNPGVCGQDF
jgi:hypothetical protein